MKKIVAGVLLAVVLAGCGNSDDFVYNEVVSSGFLERMKALDEDQVHLHEGRYTNPQDADRTTVTKEIGFRFQDLHEELEKVKTTPHSQKADKFAQGTTRYYESQLAYYELLKRYSEASEAAEQQKLLQELDAAYELLDAQPDQLKAVQEEFFAEAGISASK